MQRRLLGAEPLRLREITGLTQDEAVTPYAHLSTDFTLFRFAQRPTGSTGVAVPENGQLARVVNPLLHRTKGEVCSPALESGL